MYFMGGKDCIPTLFAIHSLWGNLLKWGENRLNF